MQNVDAPLDPFAKRLRSSIDRRPARARQESRRKRPITDAQRVPDRQQFCSQYVNNRGRHVSKSEEKLE